MNARQPHERSFRKKRFRHSRDRPRALVRNHYRELIRGRSSNHYLAHSPEMVFPLGSADSALRRIHQIILQDIDFNAPAAHAFSRGSFRRDRCVAHTQHVNAVDRNLMRSHQVSHH